MKAAVLTQKPVIVPLFPPQHRINLTGIQPGPPLWTLMNNRLSHDTVPLVGAVGSWPCLHQPNMSQMNPVCNLTFCLLSSNFVRISHYYNAFYVPRTSDIQTMCKEQWSFYFPPVNASVSGLYSVLSYSIVCLDVLKPRSSLKARDQILHPHKTTSRGL